MALSAEQFAARIKEKYPVYKDMDDTRLVLRVLDRFPEYKSQVDIVDFDTKGSEIAKEQEKPSGKNVFSTKHDIAKGIVKGAVSTFRGISSLGERALSKITGRPSPEVQKGTTASETLIPESVTTPENTAQKVGFTGEQIAEFFIPGMQAGKAGQAVKGLKFLQNSPKILRSLLGATGRVAAEATTAGGVATLQEGKINERVSEETLTEAALSLVFRGGSFVAKKTPQFIKGVDNIISGLDDHVKSVLDPRRRVVENITNIENVKNVENISNISDVNQIKTILEDRANKVIAEIKPTLAEQARNTNQRLNFYLDKARKAVSDPRADTPFEFVGARGVSALEDLSGKLSDLGKKKQQLLVDVGENSVQGIAGVKKTFFDGLKDRLNITIKQTDEGIEFVPVDGRVSSVPFDKEDQTLIRKSLVLLSNLQDSDAVLKVDGTVDALQDFLYKTQKNITQPINSKLEGLMKEVTGELNELVKKSAGDSYRRVNAKYASIVDIRNDLNKALGKEGNKGASLVKRIFSPTDGGTKKLFKKIEQVTGINLIDEAVLAKFAMEEAGDARQANLLEEIIKIRDPKSFVSKMVDNAIKKIKNPVREAKKISEKSLRDLGG